MHRLDNFSETYGSFALKDIGSQSVSNYQYNNIGHMIRHSVYNINFNYDVTGKVASYITPEGTGSYYYNDAGFRSTVKSLKGELTHYVRDLSVNIMAIYNQSGTPIEYAIYGKDRIGVAYESNGSLAYNYELKDHLGNVRATFSNSDLTDATGYSDYYPFGWKMPNRMADAANKYRFGYQGQFAEKDEETGYNQFELRLYDAMIGRWLNSDPKYQYFSPYFANGNDPVNRIDPDGGDDWYMTGSTFLMSRTIRTDDRFHRIIKLDPNTGEETFWYRTDAKVYEGSRDDLSWWQRGLNGSKEMNRRSSFAMATSLNKNKEAFADMQYRALEMGFRDQLDGLIMSANEYMSLMDPTARQDLNGNFKNIPWADITKLGIDGFSSLIKNRKPKTLIIVEPFGNFNKSGDWVPLDN